MDSKVRILDETVVDEIRRFPQPDLIRRLFPGHPVKNRGAMPSPLREDRNASFSCFCSSGGAWKGKDFSTGDVYDNIALYRAVFPSVDFVEAVDSLSWLIFNKSALADYSAYADRSLHRLPSRRFIRRPEAEKPSALKVIKVAGLDDSCVPEAFGTYWKSRGISDANIRNYCVYAQFESLSLKGRDLIDITSGLPILDDEGNEMKDDGRRESIGFYNDIGGIVFRVPDTPERPGFKGADKSFISTVLANGSRPSYGVIFQGGGDNVIHFSTYDPSTFSLYVNPSQRFYGLSPQAAHFAAPLINEWKGKVMDERDVKRICAVLTAMNSPICGRAAVVEGMFDGLSFIELQGMCGRGFRPGVDLVVLNSITNLKWAVPFLSMHSEVQLILDNDIKSGAGNKAGKELADRIREYSSLCGKTTFVHSDDRFLGGHKDLNDAIVAEKRRLQKKKC